ncbi:SGNH/GDSL hydrolase family protein [Winogradskyella sp.]|uniref:SGNH/GDSL hydrolase family protein n=1 Tax=Winogradskyella sp. TaxID=1883156 RepID=UPI003F6BA7DD
MKKALHIVVTVAIFLLVGELLIRFNRSYDLLNDGPKGIEVKVEASQLKAALDANTFTISENQLRIMVLGDSYIHGGGIASKDKFSKKLKEALLQSEQLDVSVYVLDISRPSNNTFDNYQAFLSYQEQFKPQLVFWAYNFNDVLGDFKHRQKPKASIEKSLKSRKIESQRTPKAIAKQVYSKSQLARYVSTNLQKELKLRGFVLPVGDFHFLVNEGYNDEHLNWKHSKTIIEEVNVTCKMQSAKLMLYKMPEFNLLERPQLFTNVNKRLENFTKTKTILYLNGDNDFAEGDIQQFMISKYDGHPSAYAHKIIADSVAKYIINNLDKLK